jgi:hypothetical protein
MFVLLLSLIVHVNGFSNEIMQCDQVDIEGIAEMSKKDCCFRYGDISTKESETAITNESFAKFMSSLKQSMEVLLFLLKILHRYSYQLMIPQVKS